MSEVPGREAPTTRDDGFLHVWECPRLLRPGTRTERRCGYISAQPGVCPYDHGDEIVVLVEIVATVHCSGCSVPIMRDDGRARDGRLICSECALGLTTEAGSVDAS